MTDYRANRVPGDTYFFTVRLCDPAISLTDRIAAFSAAIRAARVRMPFHLDAWIALPDHAHTIWTLPPGEHDGSARWRAVKIAFSKSLGSGSTKPHGTANGSAHGNAVWERHFQQEAIRGPDHYRCLVERLHADPVRHGLCARAEDWPWSSLQRFISAGWHGPS